MSIKNATFTSKQIPTLYDQIQITKETLKTQKKVNHPYTNV